MAKRTQLPKLDRARLEALNRRLQIIGTPVSTQNAIMASLNAAANKNAETPESGMASLPNARRNIAERSAQEAGQVFSFSNSFQVDFEEQQEFSQSLQLAQNEGKEALEWAIVLGLLAYFLFPKEQEKSLYDSILSAYVSSYQLALKEQSMRYGCSFARIGSPTPYSYAQMQEWAKRDSSSIGDTYNREAHSKLKKLYEANPLGAVSYYLDGMAQWANTRALRKGLTIGINNVQAGYQLGLEDFHIFNKLETKYRFVGSAPVCVICVKLFSMGHVDFQTMQSNSAPIHVNCSHWWQSVNTYTIDCATIWSGI
jgi:hypothetical protein